MSDRFTKLLHYILPSFLLEHFDLSDIQEIDGILHITLEELNVVPIEFAGQKLLSKGFFKSINVQDFPIRGQRVFLKIKRRRWIDTDSGKVVYRDWNLIAKGTRMTEEFAAFLKRSIDTQPCSIETVGIFHGVEGRTLQRNYKNDLSLFASWEQRKHAHQYVLFPQNLGARLSIDETCLSHGELYTILTNKASKGKKGSVVAIVAGTKADKVIEVLCKIPLNKRNRVHEVTLDMSGSMDLIVRRSFPLASRVTDRFHVQKLAVEALQEMRIKYRWEALDQENVAIEKCRRKGKTFQAELLENGDSVKQLLARSRYVLYKRASKWTESQKQRANILFERYPDLKRAYNLSMELSNIFENTEEKIYGMTRLARWHEKVRQAGFRSFNTISRTIQNHYKTILNYFDNRSTNAAAESFNAKVKAFRSSLRGVRDVKYFLFRLTNIYA